jgi:hypothetical protein
MHRIDDHHANRVEIAQARKFCPSCAMLGREALLFGISIECTVLVSELLMLSPGTQYSLCKSCQK